MIFENESSHSAEPGQLATGGKERGGAVVIITPNNVERLGFGRLVRFLRSSPATV